ncbi:hypothetical protein KSE_52440 [Kitasatospora setae KM-6054]|uniref:Uncharacterized protein n=1 Tax=Kitasatospora setae (strain ATCC 33774 / DSM 43861 / JCM 3304 / KCC A-0304 / NBRC 14216 / KM-6054) TaxID=452652 RepID=E4NHN8_KITSK|nr:hypothetical protein KSE_52440 [Kitasatospora setae KM-6054]
MAFPRELSTELALNFLRSLSGPLRRGVSPPCSVAFELSSTGLSGLTYVVNMPKSTVAEVQQLLLAHLPGAVVTPVAPTADPVLTTRWAKVIEIGVNQTTEPLNATGPAATMATLLSALGGLKPKEAILTQWVIYDARPLSTDTSSRKTVEPRWRAVGRIAVAGTTPDLLLSRLKSAYSTLATEDGSPVGGVRVYRRLVSPGLAERRLRRRAGALLWPSVVNAAELLVLTALPVGTPQVAGLKSGSSRRLAAHHLIPRTGGVLLGRSNFPGDNRLLAIPEQDRAAHCLVVGPTGTGKTTLLENMINCDLVAGRGLLYVDPKGDSVQRVLDLVPPERLGDVLLWDVTDNEQVVSFNPLAGPRPDRIAGHLMPMFDQLFGFSTSTPRAYDVLRNVLMALATCGYTLVEVPLALLPGPRGEFFRRHVLGRLDNPELLDFWRWLQGLSPRELAETAAPIVRRLRPFLVYPELRVTFGQTTSALDLREVLANRRIVLVPLYSDDLGEEATVVGSLVFHSLWRAIQNISLLENYNVYADEFGDLASIGAPFGDMLAKARSRRLPLTLATQDVGRLTEAIRKDVMNGTRTKVLFQPADSDLKYLRSGLGDWATEHDLASLGPREFIARINVGGSTTPPASGVTLPPPPPVGLGQAAHAASRTRYGKPWAEAAAAIQHRLDRLSGCASNTDFANSQTAPEPSDPADWQEWGQWEDWA